MADQIHIHRKTLKHSILLTEFINHKHNTDSALKYHEIMLLL